MGRNLEHTRSEYREDKDVGIIYLGRDFMEKTVPCAQEIANRGAKGAVLDFEAMSIILSSGLGQIVLAYDVLYKQNGIQVRFRNIGEENQYPHKALRLMGILSFPGIQIGGSLDETVAELSQ